MERRGVGAKVYDGLRARSGKGFDFIRRGKKRRCELSLERARADPELSEEVLAKIVAGEAVRAIRRL